MAAIDRSMLAAARLTASATLANPASAIPLIPCMICSIWAEASTKGWTRAAATAAAPSMSPAIWVAWVIAALIASALATTAWVAPDQACSTRSARPVRTVVAPLTIPSQIGWIVVATAVAASVIAAQVSEAAANNPSRARVTVSVMPVQMPVTTVISA